MRQFIYRLLNFSIFGLLSIAVLISLYLYFDPFKVLRDYDTLVNTDTKGMVTLNQDYVSTTSFINNSKKLNYNSFILGNSRSIFYQITDWKKHLDSNDICFHFDASGESIYAIDKKIAFINKHRNNIDNILLILDYSTLIQDKEKSGHLGIISPVLVNNSNIFEFHKTFFLSFLTPKFLFAFLDFKISGYVKPYMKKNYLLDDRPMNYDVMTNELRFDYFEELIRKNKYYTPDRLAVFYKRDSAIQKYSPKAIHENQKRILSNIHSITEKHKTSIKIIINPLYDQLKLHQDDLKYLQGLFGTENVFDYSGINKITSDYRNYYEASHYRPHVTREIMNKIYHSNK